MRQKGFIAIPAILKTVPIKVWEYLAVAVVVAAYTWFVYHEGGAAPRAQLAALTTSIKDAQRIHEAEDKRKESESITAIAAKDKEYEKNAVIISAAWKSYADSLRVKPGGSSASQGSKPDTSIVVKQCNEAPGNEAVSAAISRYRSDIDAAVTDFRENVARLLAEADQQALQLISLQDEISALAKINE